jgi:hypothetical protein
MLGVASSGPPAQAEPRKPPPPLQPTVGAVTLPGTTAKVLSSVVKHRETDQSLTKFEQDVSNFDVFFDPTAADRFVVIVMPSSTLDDSAASEKFIRQTMYEVDKRTFRVVHKAHLR